MVFVEIWAPRPRTAAEYSAIVLAFLFNPLLVGTLVAYFRLTSSLTWVEDLITPSLLWCCARDSGFDEPESFADIATTFPLLDMLGKEKV